MTPCQKILHSPLDAGSEELSVYDVKTSTGQEVQAEAMGENIISSVTSCSLNDLRGHWLVLSWYVAISVKIGILPQ